MTKNLFYTGAICALISLNSARADTKIVTRYSTGGRSSDSTIYTHEGRERIETSQSAVIRQGDQKRVIQINSQTKTYLIFPLASGGDQTTAVTSVSFGKTGGTVDVKTTITDTGERKEMLGYPAWHLRVVVERHAGANACEPGDDHTEMDGWYIDFQMPTPKSQTEPTLPFPAATACNDEIHAQSSGEAKTGFPVDYTLTRRDKNGNDLVVSSGKVLELSLADQDPALFEIPAGYKEVSSPAAILRAAGARAALAPKREGVVRVAVTEPTDKTGAKTDLKPTANVRIAELLSRSGVEAVPVQSDQEARDFRADYILKTDVAELKVAGGAAMQTVAKAGRFGGLVKNMAKMAPVGALATGAISMLAGSSEARLDFLLLPLSGGQPVSGSVNGSDGKGPGLQSALSLIPSGLNMSLMAKATGGGGAMAALTNPAFAGMMNGGTQSMFSAFSIASYSNSESPAVASAISNEVKAVIEALKK